MTPSPEALTGYQALTAAAGVVPLPRTQVELTGADRSGFLHGFCTHHIKELQPGQGNEAFITNHQGKAVGHVLVFAEPDRLLLDGAPGQAQVLISHLDRFVISERVEFHDHSADWADLLLAGPQAAAVLQQLGIAPPAGRFNHQRVNLAGQDVSLRRVDFLTSDCFLLSMPAAAVAQVLPSLLTAGATSCVPEAFELARLEAGYPWFGRDISEDNLPQEVQRNEQAISFKKGCYLGQETIARLDALGHVNRVLTGLKLPAGHSLAPGDTIVQGDKKLAQLTSVGYSPRLQSNLALAYVRALHATPGKKLATAAGDAEVVSLPLL